MIIEYMSISTIDLATHKQVFNVNINNKKTFGEVTTDFSLINKILDLLPQYLFENPSLKWLDPCAGKGYFSMVLYKRLFKSLQIKIKCPFKETSTYHSEYDLDG